VPKSRQDTIAFRNFWLAWQRLLGKPPRLFVQFLGQRYQLLIAEQRWLRPCRRSPAADGNMDYPTEEAQEGAVQHDGPAALGGTAAAGAAWDEWNELHGMAAASVHLNLADHEGADRDASTLGAVATYAGGKVGARANRRTKDHGPIHLQPQERWTHSPPVSSVLVDCGSVLLPVLNICCISRDPFCVSQNIFSTLSVFWS